jgi:hypothetical protein
MRYSLYFLSYPNCYLSLAIAISIYIFTIGLKEVGANEHKIEKVKMIIALQFVYRVSSFLPY